MNIEERHSARTLLIESMDCVGLEQKNDYSGRYMYGRKCPGFITRPEDMFSNIASLITMQADEDDRYDMGDIIRNAKMDNMGLDLIVYFPDLYYSKEEE